MNMPLNIMNKKTLLVLILASVALAGCRGADETDIIEPQFPATNDPDAFIQFLNPLPGVPEGGAAVDEIDNVQNFPEAYYNTIDPDATRDSLLKWRVANGFANEDGTLAVCDPSACEEANVKFRDTKDLGYGRNMFMRWNKDTGDVAVYVKNYLVRADGLDIPYGPVNLEALINEDEQWNFGVNAIEFSAFPYSSGGKFTKFYNFAGDGNLTNDVSGTQKHFVDLDRRGNKPMPTTCIVCHGGRGETLVYQAADGKLKVAPSLVGGIAGDVQAQLQTIEFDTLQFADAPGFTREENQDGIRLINEAILSAYQHRKQEFTGDGDWDADLAIGILSERYAGDLTNNNYDGNTVPAGWSNNLDLYRSLMGPNCMVCHALRGTRANNTGAFPTAGGFLPAAIPPAEGSPQSYAARVDHLIFEQGKMPLGLLNYSDFWGESVGSDKDPATMATALGLTNRVDANNSAIRPGAPVAVITAPPVATGFDASGTPVDIAVTGSGSAFASVTGHRWTVSPDSAENTASVTSEGISGDAVLRVSAAGTYALTLTVDGKNGGSSTATETVSVISASDGGTPGSAISYFGAGGIHEMVSANGCVGCHSPNGNTSLPIHFTACQSDEINGNEFLYRSVLARVNFDSPLDSLFLRKPSNGSTDSFNRANTQVLGYHAGGYALPDNTDYSKILSWIINGAPAGDIPSASTISATAAGCTQ
jgi:mono/diheme cytochrome c family protein